MRSRLPSTTAVAGGTAAFAMGYTLLRYGAWHLARERKKQEGLLGRLESRWVQAQGLDMHYRASLEEVPEDRAPVVLVHGLGVSSRYMLRLAQEGTV